ncbi:MAG: hypothetical protein FWH07_03600, partial [Oscillospiraceae bacterium]|nr:hypothetical protein [Oscillospiraceae bacterium]
MKKYKTITAIILTITILISIITIPTTTATQYEFTVNEDNATIVGFGGKQWAVIGYDGDGVASATNTLTLLLANGQSYGTSAFRPGQSSDPGDGTMKQNPAANDSWWYANNPSDMTNWDSPNEYRGSTLQQQMDVIADGLPEKENALIITRK